MSAPGRGSAFLFVSYLAALLATLAWVPAAADGAAQPRMRARPTLPEAVQNPGFEETDAAPRLAAWGVVMHAGDKFRVEGDAGQAYAGKQSLIIENIGPTSWGGAAQSIRAGRFAGRDIELSAWVRTRAVTAPGFHLALKSTQAGIERQYVTTDAKLVGDIDWRLVKLRTRVPKEADSLDLALTLEGDGRAWVDEVRLESLPD